MLLTAPPPLKSVISCRVMKAWQQQRPRCEEEIVVTAKGEVKQPEKKFLREENRCQPGGSSEEAERNQDEQGQAKHDEDRGSAERTEGYFTSK